MTLTFLAYNNTLYYICHLFLKIQVSQTTSLIHTNARQQQKLKKVVKNFCSCRCVVSLGQAKATPACVCIIFYVEKKLEFLQKIQALFLGFTSLSVVVKWHNPHKEKLRDEIRFDKLFFFFLQKKSRFVLTRESRKQIIWVLKRGNEANGREGEHFPKKEWVPP